MANKGVVGKSRKSSVLKPKMAKRPSKPASRDSVKKGIRIKLRAVEKASPKSSSSKQQYR